MTDNYEQFGPEWRAQVMKHRKSNIVDLLAEAYKENSKLKDKLNKKPKR